MARQLVAMHHALRDKYRFRARVSDAVLLSASLVFCATTFASDYIFEVVGIAPRLAKAGLGFASVASFGASVVMLIVDWKGAAARHADAALTWSRVVSLFREYRNGDGTWPEDFANTLNEKYWEASHNAASIPDKSFNSLKAEYLKKVAVSERMQSAPGAPMWLIVLLVRCSGSLAALRSEWGRNGVNREGER